MVISKTKQMDVNTKGDGQQIEQIEKKINYLGKIIIQGRSYSKEQITLKLHS